MKPQLPHLSFVRCFSTAGGTLYTFILLIFSIVFNFQLGKYLAAGDKPALLVGGVAVNLGLLGYFKYAGFIVTNLSQLLSENWSLGAIILPLAISFFTFQQIAYLVDSHRGITKEYQFLHYALFVSFFPQLIAGPIVHHKDMLPQFIRSERFRVSPVNLAIGPSIFAIGLFKKTVLADGIAVYANPVFGAADAGAELDFFSAWGGVLAYTFQLYFDFSGYSDMAIGLARMFGIVLPLNFYSPYKAASIDEFWRRWHITLSNFLRDYLYIPLGGNRRGSFRRYAQSAHHHDSRRYMAWSWLEFFHLGCAAWRIFGDKPIVAQITGNGSDW